MRCTSCGSERYGRPAYCGACGMAMLTDCPICEHSNELDTRFCESCGAEVDEVLPGFPLSFAQTCRDTFGDMGWWDDPIKFQPQSFEMLERAGLPRNSNSPSEYWLFVCPADRTDWKIGDIALNRQRVSGGSQRGSFPVLGATRSRLMLWDDDQFRHWPYRDVTSTALQDRDVGVQFATGDLLQFRVNAKGPRTLAVVASTYWSTTGNTAERYLSSRNVAHAREAKADFMGVIGTYLEAVKRFGVISGQPTTVGAAVPADGSTPPANGTSSRPGTLVPGTGRVRCPNCSYESVAQRSTCKRCHQPI
jgi:hypothetical protein